MNLRELKKKSLRIPIPPELRNEIEHLGNLAFAHVMQSIKSNGLPFEQFPQLPPFMQEMLIHAIRRLYDNGVLLEILNMPKDLVQKYGLDKILGREDYQVEVGIASLGDFRAGAAFMAMQDGKFLIALNPALVYLEGHPDTFIDNLTHEVAHALDPLVLKRSVNAAAKGVADDGDDVPYHAMREEIIAHVTQITDRIARRLFFEKGMSREEALAYVANNSLERIVSENKEFFESFFYGINAIEYNSSTGEINIEKALSQLFSTVNKKMNENNRKIFYKNLYNAINEVYSYYENVAFRERKDYERYGPEAFEILHGRPYNVPEDGENKMAINLRDLKKRASKKSGLEKKASNEIYMMHIKSREPDLGEVEYWKSGPKRYDVRPRGWRDCLGSIIEFQDAYILVDEPDDEMYPTVEDGVHALVKQHEKRCKQQRSMDWKDLFAGSRNLKDLRKFAMRKHAIAKGHVLMEVEHSWDDPDLLVDFSIKTHELERFLDNWGERGAEDIKSSLQHLIKVVDEYMENADESQDSEE